MNVVIYFSHDGCHLGTHETTTDNADLASIAKAAKSDNIAPEHDKVSFLVLALDDCDKTLAEGTINLSEF